MLLLRDDSQQAPPLSKPEELWLRKAVELDGHVKPTWGPFQTHVRALEVIVDTKWYPLEGNFQRILAKIVAQVCSSS